MKTMKLKHVLGSAAVVALMAGTAQADHHGDGMIDEHDYDAVTEETNETMESVGEAASDAGRYLEDAALTARVNTAFVVHSDLSALAIEVESTDGVVTLSGTVSSEAEKALAEEVAAGVDGVEDVHNALEVE